MRAYKITYEASGVPWIKWVKCGLAVALTRAQCCPKAGEMTRRVLQQSSCRTHVTTRCFFWEDGGTTRCDKRAVVEANF